MAVRNVRRGEADDDVVAVLKQLATLTAELKADFNALLAKLDADTGVNDTNFVSTRAVAAPDADTLKTVY